MSTRSFLIALTVAVTPIAVDAVDAGAATTLSVEQAREIALREVPGTILEEDLEREQGVWVYSFEIRSDTDPKVVHEIEIDADTGAVVEIEVEDDDDDDDDDRDDD